MQGKQQSANWRKHLYVGSSEYIATVTGHRGINFLNDYDEADEEGRRWLHLSCNIQMNNKNPRAEKKQILYLIRAGVSDITTTVAPLTHRWQRRKKTNCLLHFRVLKKSRSMNPAMRVSGTENDKQSLKSSASVFHLIWLPEVFSCFQNCRILLVSAELS